MKKTSDFSDEMRIMSSLMAAEKCIENMRENIITEVGRENRAYRDEEEWKLARLEEASGYVGKARFMVAKLGFKVSHEVSAEDSKKS